MILYYIIFHLSMLKKEQATQMVERHAFDAHVLGSIPGVCILLFSYLFQADLVFLIKQAYHGPTPHHHWMVPCLDPRSKDCILMMDLVKASSMGSDARSMGSMQLGLTIQQWHPKSGPAPPWF